MPIEYPGGGVVAEHTAVRDRVGVFDVSHLGKARVSGPGAADFVNACLTNDLRRIGPGQAQYTMCCTETGGVVDDLIQYLRTDDDVFLIPNAANTGRVVELLAAAAPDGITVENLHDRYGVIAVQGPQSDEVLRGLGLPVDHDYMSFVETRLGEPAGHRLPHRLHRREGVRARAAVGRRRIGLGCRALRGDRARRPAGRPGRPRHPAHRDGLPAARQRPVARHHPRHGGRGVGRRLGQAAVLGPRGAHRPAGREGVAPHARPRRRPAAGSRARTARSRTPPARSSARSRRARSRRPCARASPWPCSTGR